MRVLVIGSGGREHALTKKIAESERVTGLYAMPGSAGIESLAVRVPGDTEDPREVLRVAREIEAEFVVVGPEGPLAVGVVDTLADAGVPAFGPMRAAARLESSKVYAKEVMRQAGVPTAASRVFEDADEARQHLASRGFPVVIKADGLAAGKGVTVAPDHETADAAIREAMIDRRFGSAGSRVIIEDCLHGKELSVMAISDGKTVLPLAPARDYKAVNDGDRGPNTGGMGCVSPVPGVDAGLLEDVRSRIMQPVVTFMRTRGIPFRGVLYAGLMLTEEGPMVLEFNCRFGDPETQVVLPRMQSDIVPLLLASAGVEGDLAALGARLRWHDGAAVCVVMASGGYPGSYEVGLPIRGLESVPEDVIVYHAGTHREEKGWVTAGGRVLGVTGLGLTPGEARRRAYEGVRVIDFPGAHYRTDIAEE